MTKTKSIWWRVRWIIYALQFIAGLAGGAFPPATNATDATVSDFPLFIAIPFLVFFFAAIPLMTAAVISFQAINPYSAAIWQRPTHETNPFQLRDPLHFFHFAGHAALSCGVGIVLASPFSHFRALGDGAFAVIASLGVLAGVRLTMRLCRHKLNPK